MKVVCHICEQVFEESKVFFGEGEDKKDVGFTLIPTHPPVEGKPVNKIFTTQGVFVKAVCKGSLRPPQIRVS